VIPRFLVGLLCILALSACAGRGPDLSATPVTVDTTRAAAKVNAVRAREGLAPVRLEPRLMQAATDQALAMAKRNRMSHNVGDGSLPRRLNRAGYDPVRAAENIGAGYANLEAAMEGWERSAPHRRNLLLASVTEIGVAAAHAPGSRHGTYWALILAEPRPLSEPPAPLWGISVQ
jgi:uncharacterized protein YkwD